ncbi:HAD-superfamily phosphatase, subfamily IIIC/FkbH-like domain-containing protein [Granulicella pectinivorans]|uniref:HAD-superfamily phosphatase, subfamily IIIC/FkbH-like domain-containing protein n=1 Tax=Granulicella pectinivorans TaxID=474950 RepID=A0A1I6LKW9_9BACT|nr:HAD-IIIC family phosphatase [Granulicella pectinivorans]SFS04053.1 HAD-superfamily phosphatase, subfamily IIIC/FkbH-like domain-containing protein [Granulicella pectinivorans]
MGPEEPLPAVARALAAAERAAAEALGEPLARWDKFSSTVASMGHETFITWETLPLVHYLIRSLGPNGADWRSLFLGERMKQLHWPAETLDELIARRETVFQQDRDALVKILAGKVPPAELEAFTARLDRWRELVTTNVRTSREIKILLVGDCLFLDITTFLAALLLERGITLRPVFAASKNPVEMNALLRTHAADRFDLVCYSPYTYEQNLSLARTHFLQGIRSGPATLRTLADEAHAQMLPTFRMLGDLFECGVYVHNTANVRRHDGTPLSFAKNLITAYARRTAAKRVNELLDTTLREHNASAPRPAMLIDERALLARFGDINLSRKFYSTESVHPTVLSLRLAEIYTDFIGAVAGLTGRKVVVVDLDHTLWAGVIGEGAVQHHRDRQQTLKRLRAKGILLAIASKNDASNIRWDGAVLGANDFVSQQIHWELKSTSVRRIAAELNLDAKDFVFIDDRADEREMVSAAHPGLLALDALDEGPWRMLDWWATSLPEQKGADRTQFYADRKKRQELQEELGGDSGAVLAGLGLRVSIRTLVPKELDRAVELVNRTNQFNIRGSRVTRQQMAAWSKSDTHRILVAEAADKFGGMGIVSVMVLEGEEIAIWVLSCRVFGFGIETALLNEARRRTPVLRGAIVETERNQPCREVFAANGFQKDADGWLWPGGEVPADPEWLAVTTT